MENEEADGLFIRVAFFSGGREGRWDCAFVDVSAARSMNSSVIELQVSRDIVVGYSFMNTLESLVDRIGACICIE